MGDCAAVDNSPKASCVSLRDLASLAAPPEPLEGSREGGRRWGEGRRERGRWWWEPPPWAGCGAGGEWEAAPGEGRGGGEEAERGCC